MAKNVINAVKRVISREQYNKNTENLMQKYENEKASICTKYGIKPANYDMIAEIIANEEFKRNIKDLARNGASLADEGQTIVLC